MVVNSIKSEGKGKNNIKFSILNLFENDSIFTKGYIGSKLGLSNETIRKNLKELTESRDLYRIKKELYIKLTLSKWVKQIRVYFIKTPRTKVLYDELSSLNYTNDKDLQNLIKNICGRFVQLEIITRFRGKEIFEKERKKLNLPKDDIDFVYSLTRNILSEGKFIWEQNVSEMSTDFQLNINNATQSLHNITPIQEKIKYYYVLGNLLKLELQEEMIKDVDGEFIIKSENSFIQPKELNFYFNILYKHMSQLMTWIAHRDKISKEKATEPMIKYMVDLFIRRERIRKGFIETGEKLLQTELKQNEIINNCKLLLDAYKTGKLGECKMPEDSNPGFSDKEQEFKLSYFTLPMALNYQRDSYKLWESALKTFNDQETKWVFDVAKCKSASLDELRKSLMKYKLALQPNKHINTWFKIAETIYLEFNSINEMLKKSNNDYLKLKENIQTKFKSGFPYLSGPKIFNYWCFILKEYCKVNLANSEFIEIAPDTHITQGSVKLGVITEEETKSLKKEQISEKWRELLKNSGINPIDMHPPLWFWSRKGFVYDLKNLTLKEN